MCKKGNVLFSRTKDGYEIYVCDNCGDQTYLENF